MGFQSPFRLSADDYNRDLDLIKHYITQNAFYLSKMSGQPLDVCEDYIEKNIKPGGRFPLVDPVATFTYRQDNGDRVKKQAGYLSYINYAIKSNDIIAPTLTTYISPYIKESLQVGSIGRNKKLRSINKQAMFQAERDAEAAKSEEDKKAFKEKQIFYDNAQTGNKLSNNAVSGGYCTPSTIMYNPSAHTTLTSTCRITAGYGNANNEKVLSGNRHYYNDEIVINNIQSICSGADLEDIANTQALYGIKTPTVDEVMQMVLRSTRLYWKNEVKEKRIRDFLETLNAQELAAFMYIGDLYTLRYFNDNVIRRFIDELTTKSTEPHPDPDSVFEQANDDYKVLASQIHSDFMNGKELKKLKGTFEYGLVANTLQNIFNTLNKYRPLIRTFFLTRNVPASLAYFPSSRRRSVLMGDTDSTIFTVQDWVKWSTGSYAYSEKSNAVCEALIFIASQTISHSLAIMSANIGVSKERLFATEMKNEFRFDTFTPTPKAKHYNAMIGRREANSFVERKIEVKGVHLKNSNAPKSIMKAAEEKMVQLNMKALNGEKISFVEELQFIANIEHSIVKAIKKGHHGYFRIQKIKDAGAYKQPQNKSMYLNHTMWVDVFQDKYGPVDPPPYPSLKINTNIVNKTDWNNWLISIKDESLKSRLIQFCEKYGKDVIKTFYIPFGHIIDKGLPEEIFSIIDIRRIVLGNTKVFYLILESLGDYRIDSKINKLAMDMFPMTEEFNID